jgi:hypothetical protein
MAMLLFYPGFYAALCGAIWYVGGPDKWNSVYAMMWDGTSTGFIAAQLYIFFYGLVELFFGIPLKLLGVI